MTNEEMIFKYLNNRSATSWKGRQYKMLLAAVLLLFLFLIPLLNAVPSENVRFKRISNDDGLAQVSVNCILQDKVGFLWFGTQEGLNRYDGYKFKTFRHVFDDIESLSDSFIWCLLQDHKGFIWIGTNDGGLNRFDPRTEKFKRYLHGPEKEKRLSHNYVTSLFEDKNKHLWVGTKGGGLYKFDSETETFQRYSAAKGLTCNNITAIGSDSKDNLWVGTSENELYKLTDYKTETFEHISHEQNTKGNGSHKPVNVIYKDSHGVLWVGTGGGLYKLKDPDANTFQRYVSTGDPKKGLSHNDIRALGDDGKGNLWIGTYGGGVTVWNTKDNRWRVYNRDEGDPQTLSDDRIQAILVSRSGLIWMGGFNCLNIYNPDSHCFKLYHPHPIRNSLSDKEVRCFYQDTSGILWIGTFLGGLNRFDRNLDEDSEDRFIWFKKKQGLSSNNIRCLWSNADGSIWLGTWGGGLNKIVPNNNDPENSTIITADTKGKENYKYNKDRPNSLSNDYIRTLYKDSEGILWVGTDNGLNRLNKGGDRFTHFYQKKDGLNHNVIFSIYEDKAGTLWIGTRGGGLNRVLDRNTMKCEVYTYKANMKSLNHNFVMSMFEDSKGNFWIGTFGGGLNRMVDREKKTFESYTTQNSGLPNDVVYGIIEDNMGHLWFSTNCGLSRFNPRTKEFRNFYQEDGLQSNEFNGGAYYQYEPTGELFFGGINGFNIINPNDIPKAPREFPIVYTGFFLHGKSGDPQLNKRQAVLNQVIQEANKVDQEKELKLSYDDNFSIEFAALNYARPLRVKYRYRMKGADDWTPSDTDIRRATYSKLEAGTYTFEIECSSEPGVWFHQARPIKVTVSPSPWQTGWAYLAYVMACIAMIYAVWNIVAVRILKRKVDLKEQEIKGSQSQLAHSDKMASLGILIAGVAHELNNPVSFTRTGAYNTRRDLEKLRSFIEEIAEDESAETILTDFRERFDVLFRHLETIDDGTDRIGTIVADLRTISRIDKGRMQQLDLSEGLQTTLNIVRPTFKHEVEFNAAIENGLDVTGNSAELNQVFMNVIVNACQAIREKQEKTGDPALGTLRIDTSVEKQWVVIRFQDNGIGIAVDAMRHIFEPFYTTKPVGEGTGLGMAISYSIINSHGGKIEIDSEPGIGTTVSIRLPKSPKKELKEENTVNGSIENE